MERSDLFDGWNRRESPKGGRMGVKAWDIIKSEVRDDYKIFRLRVDTAKSPRTEGVHEFYILESPDWVNVIPITREGLVVLVRQFRHGTKEVTLEIPGGLVEPGDSPEDAARRELLEETGYSAPHFLYLGAVAPNPAFLNNRCHTFLAKDATRIQMQSQDEKEDIEVLTCPLEEVKELIRKGEITHSLVIAAFYRLFVEGTPESLLTEE
jgi:8-oxo-dGTP pyrophosphatase MutT (NUDIX family)